MTITDLTCATLGHNLIVRVATDEGISGYGEIAASVFAAAVASES